MPYIFFFIARHNVLAKKNCCKWVFSDVVVRREGGEAFYCPMIRSQPFSEPELGISLFPHGRLELTEVVYFPSLRSVSL